MKFTKIALISLALIFSTACVEHHKQPVTVHQYRHKIDDSANDWIYWYVIYSNNNVYYYSSPTVVNNFTNVVFTRNTSIPSDVQKEIDTSEQLPDEVVEPEMQPTDIVEELNTDTTDSQDHGMTNEGGPDYNSSEVDTSDVSSSDSISVE